MRPRGARALVMLLVPALLSACASSRARRPVAFAQILQASPALAQVGNAAQRHRLQIVLGRVQPGPNGRPVLVQQGYRVGAEYFYPASTVKMFAAIAALERLTELRRETRLPITVDTPLAYHPLFPDEAFEDSDPGNVQAGTITVRQEIRKLFLVSDNQAFNRLYELVGPDHLAASLERAGLGEARIVHRLSEWRSVEENLRSPRVDFRVPGPAFSVMERTATPLPPLPEVPGLDVGKAHLEGDRRVEQPLDFRSKNRIALDDLQRGLCKVVRPDVDCGGGGFPLTPDHRQVLLDAMKELPRESQNPVYDPARYPDDYVKFFLPGLTRVVPLARLRVYNKIGQAYGFTTENAYVVDAGTGRAFFLAATLYTNDDEVLNDDQYEYTTVAAPFLADLAEVMARAEWGPVK